MRKNALYISILILLFIAGFWISKGDSSNLVDVKRAQILMGTIVEIQVKDADEEKANNVISKAFNEMERIDDLFSSYNEKSPVWKLNHNKIAEQELPEELFDIISFSDSIYKISDGAFDASLGNLIDIWGFTSDSPSVPNLYKFTEALNHSGWKNIQLNNRKILGYDRIVKFDFGAVAKGYAVDKAIEIIKQNGITTAMVNAGGEVKGIGYDWVVGIQHPRNENDLVGKIKLNGFSVATSGDYEQYYERNGKRYHHVLNPKTGYPAEGCQSVTIICKENKAADALATAVFVLGKEKGMRLINRSNDVEAMIIDSNSKIWYSNGFKNYLLR